MKTILSIVVFILLHSNLLLCSQANLTTDIAEMDIIEFCILINWKLKERKQTTKKFVCQQFKNGYSIPEIHDQLFDLALNTKEVEVYQQSKEIKNKLWKELDNKCATDRLKHDFCNMIDTSECNLMKQNYINTQKESKELLKLLKARPEIIIYEKISKIFSLEKEINFFLQEKIYKEKEVKNISNQKQKIVQNMLNQKQKIEDDLQEFAKKEQEFLNSLLK